MAGCCSPLQVETSWRGFVQLSNWKADGVLLCSSLTGKQTAGCAVHLQVEIRWLDVVQLWNWKMQWLGVLQLEIRWLSVKQLCKWDQEKGVSRCVVLSRVALR